MQMLNPTKDAVHADTYIFPYLTIIHEYNAHGAHRLRIQDRALKHTTTWKSDWHRYEDIIVYKDAMIPEYRATGICATTEYWAGVFPRVFRSEAAERLDGQT